MNARPASAATFNIDNKSSQSSEDYRDSMAENTQSI
jgi:hypothetical protein